jgi:hypothetical protein
MFKKLQAYFDNVFAFSMEESALYCKQANTIKAQKHHIAMLENKLGAIKLELAINRRDRRKLQADLAGVFMVAIAGYLVLIAYIYYLVN